MQTSAEAAAPNPAPAANRPIRALPVESAPEPDGRELLIRRLAADRLRDLRDDGVTMAYVARMYGVEPGEMERLRAELLPLRTR